MPATPKKSSFQAAQNNFVRHLDAASMIMPAMISSVAYLADQKRKNLEEHVSAHGKKETNAEGKETITFTPEFASQFRSTVRTAQRLTAAVKLMARSLVVSQVSVFDVLIGELIRAMLLSHPEILNASNKSMSLSELLAFKTIEEAKESIIEKEIEDVLRDSHEAHFDWFKAKLNMPVRDGLDVWPKFIEVTERRNLFVHTDGVVSKQYLNVCSKHGHKPTKELEVGTILWADDNYARSAYETLLEVGVKLTQTVWRKLVPREQDIADTALNNFGIELLSFGEYALACKIFTYAVSLERFRDRNDFNLIFPINLAQSYRWLGKIDECNDVLDSVRWVELQDKYRLAEKVLRGETNEAVTMIRLFKDGTAITKEAWAEWPLFRELRKTKEFADEYQAVYGEEFRIRAEYNLDKMYEELFGSDDGEARDGEADS